MMANFLRCLRRVIRIIHILITGAKKKVNNGELGTAVVKYNTGK